jgi:hypothetical protein
MLDYSTLDAIILSDVKLHPEYHCDVEPGQPFVYGERHKVCTLKDRCRVAYNASAVYHHGCAEREIGPNYVCECGTCTPKYSFYFPIGKGEDRDITLCPWCHKQGHTIG